MGGGLINIVSYGLDDLYLTGAAQVTFFKSSHRRHTNYSQESIEIDIGQTNFNEEINVPFPKIGDLIGTTYLQVTLPQISLLKTDIVADPTASEIAFLQKNMTLPVEYNALQSIANDYTNDVINTFMGTNMNGYRIAKDNLTIKNQTLTEYVQAILSKVVFPSSTVQSNYQNALTRALNYENSLGNHQYDVYLNYATSDISYILTNIGSYSVDEYTIEDIANLVFSATKISIKVKEYFFNKTKEYINILAMYNSDKGSSRYAKFAWTEKIGYALLERIDINIGGERIDRHYFDYLEIWHELTGFNSQNILHNKTIGNVIELTSFDRVPKPSYTVNIPLNFWFCKKAGLYFPIVALQYSQLSLTIKFNSIDVCAHVEKLPDYIDSNGDRFELDQLALSDVWDNKGYFLSAKLLTDYVYLDTHERKRFAQSAHEYLIETTQRIEVKDTTDKYPTMLLDFSGPIKEIIWYAQKAAYVQGIETQKKLLFNYTLGPNGIGNPFDSCEITLNGKKLENPSLSTFYSCIMPYARHTRCPKDGINLYPFCIWPEEHQPSGSCNMSIIPNCVASFSINSEMFKYKMSDITPHVVPNSSQDYTNETSINIVVIAKKMEILRIIGGMGGFAFKYMG